MKDIEDIQLLDSEYCLSCRGCCVFQTKTSEYRPKVCSLDVILEFKDISANIDYQKNIILKQSAVSLDKFICSFLAESNWKCDIYDRRPFECSLYPFMILKVNGKCSLYAHLACPYILDNQDSLEFRKYVIGLKERLSLKENQEFITEYLKELPVNKLALEEFEYLFDLELD